MNNKTDSESLAMLKELHQDWQKGRISAYAAMIALGIIVNLVEVSEEEMQKHREWAEWVGLEKLAQEFLQE